MTDNEAEWLRNLDAAARNAIDSVGSMSQRGFEADRRTQQAVSMSLVIVGEVASQLISHAPDLVAEHPYIPWRSMRGV
jgi:uncharacterized protein with HEPN domain